MISKAVIAAALLFPQLSAAQENSVAQRQIDTMGLPAAERVTIICEGREKSNLCQKLADDIEYRDRWLSVSDDLTRMEWAIAGALAEAHERLDRENAAVQEMIRRAPKLPDGRAIFRAQDGRYFDLDGNTVSPEEASTAQ